MSDPLQNQIEIDSKQFALILEALRRDYDESTGINKTHVSKTQSVLAASFVMTSLLGSAQVWSQPFSIGVACLLCLSLLALIFEVAFSGLVFATYQSQLTMTRDRNSLWELMTDKTDQSTMSFIDQLIAAIAAETKESQRKSRWFKCVLFSAATNAGLLLLTLLCSALNKS